MRAAHDLLPDEAAARRLLLARALDEADAQGRLVGAAEKLQAEDEALRDTAADAAATPEPIAWLQARATRITGLLEHRSPAIAALAHRSGWEWHAAWILPVLALVAGAFIDRIDNPRQVNLLSPPLLAFLLWNIAVYLLLLVHALWPRQPGKARRFAFHLPWRKAGVHAAVTAAFQRLWWALGQDLQSQRWKRILHSAAAAWGIGVALSIVLGGLVREYRVGWESTLLDLPQVHAVLQWMFALPAALLGIEPFSMAEVARLHFGSGESVARPEARRWVALYLGLIGLVVIAPRLLLALWARWRERQAAHDLRIDLGETYYAALLSRVTPADVRVAVLADSPHALERLELVLQQMGGRPASREPWTVLDTPRGDKLRAVHAEADRPAPAAVAAPWWRRAPAAPSSRPPYDLVLLAREGEERGDDLARRSAAMGVPVLALGPGSTGVQVTLPWSALPTWREDARLWQALAQACPAHQRAGVERLWQRAGEHARHRLHTSVQMLAGELLQDALDVEALPAPAVGVRQLLVREERDAVGKAQQQATSQLLARVHERQARTDERLLALHGLTMESLQRDALAAGVRLQRPVDAPQAGIAGAASGAAVGAGIDLVTGGLTLGAASALGALVGGGAAMVAAAWRNARGEAGMSSVMLDDEALPLLVRGALLRYLAIVHAGRAQAGETQAHAEAIELEGVDDLARLLRERRTAEAGRTADAQAIEAALQERIEALLQRLHGDSPTPGR